MESTSKVEQFYCKITKYSQTSIYIEKFLKYINCFFYLLFYLQRIFIMAPSYESKQNSLKKHKD
jgi:hypothetical protein